jgi:hypothetical protein
VDFSQSQGQLLDSVGLQVKSSLRPADSANTRYDGPMERRQFNTPCTYSDPSCYSANLMSVIESLPPRMTKTSSCQQLSLQSIVRKRWSLNTATERPGIQPFKINCYSYCKTRSAAIFASSALQFDVIDACYGCRRGRRVEHVECEESFSGVVDPVSLAYCETGKCETRLRSRLRRN